MFTILDKSYDCYIQVTLEVVGGKWKTLVLWHLIDGKKRFSELRRLLPTCTQRMLTRQLRELERDGIIARKIYKQIPPKVEYSLTSSGESLVPILKLACEWGITRADDLNKAGRITNTGSNGHTVVSNQQRRFLTGARITNAPPMLENVSVNGRSGDREGIRS